MGSQGATAKSAAASLYHTKTFKPSTTLLGGRGGNFHDRYRSIPGIYRVYVQRLLQDRHTPCSD
nr:MAG TPA: hypothetical protein [Caudoviricetes sp.]